MQKRAFEPDIVMRNGKPISVILPIGVYEKLLKRLEQTENVASLKRACRKPSQYRSLKKYLPEYRNK